MRGLLWTLMLAIVAIVLSVWVVFLLDTPDEFSADELLQRSGSEQPQQDLTEAEGEGLPLEIDSSRRLTSSPADFDVIARSLFTNVYRLLARQIYGDYGISKGVCIDVGAGPGYLSIELAKITHLDFILVDIDPRAVAIAMKNVAEAGLLPRFSFVIADAQDLPFKDDFADLIVSRASHFFWKDEAAGFREIHRVLKPGGVAFVGAGMGRLIPDEERSKIFEELNRLRYGPRHWGVKPPGPDEMREIMARAGIHSYELYHKPAPESPCTRELWVEIEK